MKCPICSYDDYGTGDSAHHCSAEIQPCPYCGGKEKCDSAYPHPRHNFTKAGALVAPVPAPGPVLTWQDRMKIDMRPWAQDAAMQGEIADLRAVLAQAKDAIIKRDATALRVAQCAGDFAREAAQGADDALDAARYQFMRNHQVVKEPYNMILHVAVRQPAPNGWCVDSVRGIEMDAAIDKAIAQEKAQ